MPSRLYVGNLAYSTTDDGLRDFFAAAGEVKSAEIVIERSSGRSKGFGFVEMASDEGAQNAGRHARAARAVSLIREHAQDR